VGSAALQAIAKLSGPVGTAVLGSLLTSAYVARLVVAALPPTAATAARQSIFAAMAVARRIHSPALLASARTAFVHGMDLALGVSGCTALLGVGLTLVFLPRRNATTPVIESPAETQPATAGALT
jgi:hypothetical protein